MQDYLTFQVDFNAPDMVSTYDELPLWSAMFGLLLLRHMPLKPHLTVLDVGCGTGFPLFELAQRLGSTCKVYGIDPWEAALHRARVKARVWNIHNVDLRLGTAEAMPFPNGQFDVIVSNLGVNNFSNPEAVLVECWRVAKPSAQLVLTTNLRGHMTEFYEVFASTLYDLGKQKAVEALESHVEHRSTLEGITALFSQTGFRVTKVYEEAASMRFVDGSTFLRHSFIKLGFLDGWRSVVDAGEQEVVFVQLEANLNRLAEARGELTLTIPIAYVEAEKVGRVDT